MSASPVALANPATDAALQPVKRSGCRAIGLGITIKGKIKALAVLAHPADLARRHADHQRVGRHVTVDDGTGADEGVFADGVATDDSAIGPQGGATLDQRVAIFVLARDATAGVVDVGEDHARPAEHVVFQRNVVVHRDVVLHFDVVADDDLVADKDVLAKGAVPADYRLAADMNPMPDAGVLADLRAFIDDGRRMYRVVAH